VNGVCPGPINTGMTAPIPDEAKQKFARRRVPLGRYGEPEEVAQMVLNLALPASSFVNGAIIPVDGAYCASSASNSPRAIQVAPPRESRA
jgi:3-oxoacyl-[acyl-carrier protein] reductase